MLFKETLRHICCYFFSVAILEMEPTSTVEEAVVEPVTPVKEEITLQAEPGQ